MFAKIDRTKIDRTWMVRTLLIATAALAFPAETVLARVGVTSATSGDPLGKPPSEAERVLRIGIDVQANELITTRANDRAHLLFIDGTSLTVGPNAQLTIDRFVFDPDTKTGELAVSASKGVLRLVGGKISKNSPITISTPSSTIGIRGGITLVEVEPDRTRSTFLFGKAMSVTALGRTEMVTRQGSQVTTMVGAVPGTPRIVPPGALAGSLKQLEGGETGSGNGSATTRTAATGGATGTADQKAQSSGFSSQNANQATAALQPSVAGTGASPGQSVANANIVSNALSNAAADQQQQQAIADRTRSTTNPSPGSSVGPSPDPTPQTQVIVTRGRYAAEPSYSGFNNQTLGVTPIAANNQQLAATGTLRNGVATVSLADGRSLSVPWQPGSGQYAISLTDPSLGALTGTGYVSAAGDFFVFALRDSGNRAFGFAGGTPTSLAQFPTSGFAAHTLSSLDTAGGLPFASASVAGNALLKAAATVSPLYSAYNANSNPVVGGPTLNNQAAVSMQATVAIAGTGAGQISYVGVFIGDYFKDFNSNSTFDSGHYQGTYRLGAAQPIGRLTSAESTTDTGGGHSIYGPDANTMVFSQTSYRSTTTSSGSVIASGTTTVSPQASFDQPFNNLAGSDYGSTTVAIKTATPADIASRRTTQSMTGGYVGGIVESANATGGVIATRTIGTTGAAPGDVTMNTDAAANRVFATINVGQWDGANTSARFFLGGTSGARFSTSAFINDQVYAARDRPTDSFANQVASVTNGGTTSTGTDIAARTEIVSYGAAPVAQFFASQGVTPCTCEFMTWGWWGGDVRYNAASAYNPNGRDRLGLASYVTGTVTPTVQLPATGTATFSGHAVGNVVNNGASYVAAGSFTGVWNFAAQNGTVAINNFDGTNYAGAASQSGGTAATASQFNGSIAGGGRTGSVTGSFFTGSVPAQGMGGSFAISGPNYKAGGTFAGQR